MTRKHICIYQPTCCGNNFPGQSTDTSADVIRPYHKTCSRRRSSIRPVDMCPPRFNKHKESQTHSKHVHTCFHGPQRCNRLSAERSTSAFNYKSKTQNIYRYEDSSTDTRSVSSISQCPSALSVDVSCEMAAVNKELDALLTRYERTLGRGGRKPSAPIGQVFRPRPPSLLRENLAAAKLAGSKSFPLNEQSGNSTQTPNNQTVRMSPAPARLEESESSEMLKNMWDELRLQGIVPSNEDIGKNIQKIYTKMKLDDSNEVKIDISGLSSMAKTLSPKEKKITSNPIPTGTKSSVSTQTKFGYERISANSNQMFPLYNRGDGDNNLSSLNERIQEGLNNKKYSESSKVFSSGDGNIPRFNKNIEVYNDLVKTSNISLPSDRTETILCAAQNGLDTLNKLKNFNDLTLGNEMRANPLKKPQTDYTSFEKRYQLRNHQYQNTIIESLGRIECSLNSQDHLISSCMPESEKTRSPDTAKPTNGNSDGSKISQNSKESITLKLLSEHQMGFDGNSVATEKNHCETGYQHPALSIPKLQHKTEILSEEHHCLESKSYPSKTNSRQAPEYQASRESNNGGVKEKSICSNVKGGIIIHSETVEDQNISNESIDAENKNEMRTSRSTFSSSINKSDSTGYTNSQIPQTVKMNGSAVADTPLSDKNEGLIGSRKTFTEENSPEIIHLKEAMKKENLEKLDPSLCAELIRRVTDTMMHCNNSQVTDELGSGNSLLNLLKQLRSEILKHIQVQVKQIEDLDKYLEFVGINKLSLHSHDKSHVDK